jgi:hypothetical protein
MPFEVLHGMSLNDICQQWPGIVAKNLHEASESQAYTNIDGSLIQELINLSPSSKDQI